MFVGRKSELTQLTDACNAEQNRLVMLYGRDGIGKTALIREFLRDKTAWFYEARECTEREQLFVMRAELEATEGFDEKKDLSSAGYLELFREYTALAREKDVKPIIVIDEVQRTILSENSFIFAFTELLRENAGDKGVMLIFLSSSTAWVENRMISDIGVAARYITDFIKLKGLSFMELVEFFPKLSTEDCIYISAALGGVPKYLELWKPEESIKENLLQLFFLPKALLKNEAEGILKGELRELGAYNTILSTMSKNQLKLNDIYARTGFSRAKISVYLKNLIAMDLVEKVFSYERGDRDAVKKGLYRINDNFLSFWYRFVFGNASSLAVRDISSFYEEYLKKDIELNAHEMFVGVCTEYVKLMSKYKRLKEEYQSFGTWYGKKGRIDIIGEDNNRKLVIGECFWSDEPVGENEVLSLTEVLKEAFITPNEIILFSKSDFDKVLKEKEYFGGKPILVSLKDL